MPTVRRPIPVLGVQSDAYNYAVVAGIDTYWEVVPKMTYSTSSSAGAALLRRWIGLGTLLFTNVWEDSTNAETLLAFAGGGNVLQRMPTRVRLRRH